MKNPELPLKDDLLIPKSIKNLLIYEKITKYKLIFIKDIKQNRG